MTRYKALGLVGLVSAMTVLAVPAGASAGGSFIGGFSKIDDVGSTVPGNGDVNPYGTVVVPTDSGKLVAGDVLISNFNAMSNLQGTGTTVVELSPQGGLTLFAQIDAAHLPGPCPGGVGLTTALAVLPRGFVVVGSLPTSDGSPATIGSGCLLVLNSDGVVVETLSGRDINGPWDMTAVPTKQGATLFVTNVLNGTVPAGGSVVNDGTVVRIDLHINGRHPKAPKIGRTTIIGSGFAERTDPNALVVGPTGVGLGPDGSLYVADSASNRIAAIPDAMGRHGTAFTGLDVTSNGAVNDPLGLTIAPGGDVLTVNGNDGNIVETTPDGAQVAVKQLDSSGTTPGAGALFGLAVAPQASGVYFVDDASNTLELLH